MARTCVGRDRRAVLNMRAEIATLLALPVVLAGCPALLSDWTLVGTNDLADSGADPAVLDGNGEAGPEADARGRADGRDGTVKDEDAGSGTDSGDHYPDVGPDDAGSGDGAADTEGGGPGQDASLCDGAGLSTHHTGLGQTWTDCVPPGTHDAAEASKACNAWCAVNGCLAPNPPPASQCSIGSFCGVSYTVGQVGISGPNVKMMGWANDGEVVTINPVTQTSCTQAGSWD